MSKSENDAVLWIRYNIGQWASSTTNLGNEHIGAFYRLLHHAGSNHEIPAGHTPLSFITRLDLEEIPAFLEMMRLCDLFVIDPENPEYLHCRMLDEALAESQKYKDSAKERGKLGGYHAHKSQKAKQAKTGKPNNTLKQLKS